MSLEIEPSVTTVEVAAQLPRGTGSAECLGSLDSVGTESLSTGQLLTRLEESPIIERPVAVNFIAEMTEHLVELSFRRAIEKMGTSVFSLDYFSAYNHVSPRYGRNDQGCEFVISLDGTAQLKTEVEQRTSGYMRRMDYEREVRRKLSGVEKGRAIYVFFNGFSQDHLDALLQWTKEDGIETISLPPLPYTKQTNDCCKFDALDILDWFLDCLGVLTEVFFDKLLSFLFDLSQEEDDY